MSLRYWLLESIEQATIDGGFTIVTTTDVACHQWLRHTLTLPQKHKKPVLRRGIQVYEDARFCFVAYQDLEQNEVGDTFTHTFTWLGWTECQTRFFYFWATWMGEKMISTSPIFSKHYVAPKIFIALCHCGDHDTRSGVVTGFMLAHTCVGLSCRPTFLNVLATQQAYSADRWYLRRGALVLDTIELPPEWEFESATLHYRMGPKYDAASGPLCFVNAKGIPIPCDGTSYQALRTKTDILASVDWSDITEDAEHSVVLDPAKLYFLNPGGLTIIGVREYNELIVNAAAPPDVAYGYALQSCELYPEATYLVITGK